MGDPAQHRGVAKLRRLDRQLGVPLVAVLGLRPRRAVRPSPAQVSRLGILKSAAIGDTVLLSGVIADLASTYPTARITAFVGPDNAGVAKLLEGVDQVVVLPMTRPLDAAKQVRKARLDLLIDFGSWTRLEALLSATSGARYTVGFRTPGQHRHFAQDLSIAHSGEIHEVDNYRQLVAGLGVTSATLPHLRPPGVLPQDRLPTLPYAVLHPWPSGWRSFIKEWPEARWVEVARRLTRAGLAVVLTGGKADVARSRALAFRCQDRAGIEVTDTAGRLGLPEVVDLLAASGAVVSVNTGIMHMAAAVGVPTVALNGPTSERRWGPVGPACSSVSSALPGCGYLNLGAEYEGQRQDCMLGIEVDQVMAATFAVMKQPQSKSGAVTE